MSDKQTITLEWYEQVLAGVIGTLRQVEAARLNCKPSSTKDDHAMARNIEAAGAELAVAKFLQRYWHPGVNRFRDPDVAPNVEVRQTTLDSGRLIIRKRSADPMRRYVLVRGTMPTFEVVGWIWGRDGMREEWVANPRGDGEVYLVPAAELRTEFKLADD